MRELKVLTGRTVVVASTGATVRGVIESVTRSFVTLVDAVEVGAGSPKPIDGMVLIPTGRVLYVQAVM